MTWGIARKEKIFIIMTMITLLTILASIIYCYEAEAFQKSVKLISEVPRYRRLCCYLLVMAGGCSILVYTSSSVFCRAILNPLHWRAEQTRWEKEFLYCKYAVCIFCIN